MSCSTWSCKCALVLSILVVALAGASAQGAPEPASRVYLHGEWRIQSSCVAKATGEQISALGFDASEWHAAKVPTTVGGALVGDKTFLVFFYAMNLHSFPGMYPSNKVLFANRELPKDSPFLCSWWYRGEFAVPAVFEQQTSWMIFLGS